MSGLLESGYSMPTEYQLGTANTVGALESSSAYIPKFILFKQYIIELYV